jgi:sortase A
VFWRVGWGLVAAGLLVVAFWCYLVWGTTFAERSGQTALAHALSRQFVERPSSRPASSANSAFVWPRLANGAAVARIQIPAIGVNQVVVEGTDTGDLQNGPGHYTGTPLPGETGNVAIAGHRTTYGRPFYHLDELGTGDQITLSIPGQTWRYVTTGSMVVSPDDVAVVGPIPGSGGWLTLTTCNPPYSASTRLVVRARLVGHLTPKGTSVTEHRPSVPPAISDAQGSWGRVALWGAVLLVIGVMALVVRAIARTWARRAVWAALTLLTLAAIWELFSVLASRLPAGF